MFPEAVEVDDIRRYVRDRSEFSSSNMGEHCYLQKGHKYRCLLIKTTTKTRLRVVTKSFTNVLLIEKS